MVNLYSDKRFFDFGCSQLTYTGNYTTGITGTITSPQLVDYSTLTKIMRETEDYKQQKHLNKQSASKKCASDILSRLRSETNEFCKNVSI